MPPRMVEGKIQGAVTVSEGTLVMEDDTTHSDTLVSESQSEETEHKVKVCDVE